MLSPSKIPSLTLGNGNAMSRIFHPLMYLLACATHQELARQVQFLKTENEILRSRLPKRITVTSDQEAATQTVLEQAEVLCADWAC